jgi:LmbE family N-acetylglucosaminyl deacetylase
MIEIQNAVLVVAHPDDEILWFSSILDQCKSVVVCFGPSAASKHFWDSGRAVVMKTYPLTKVEFLEVRQSDAFDAANWNRPKETDSGLQLRRRTRPLYERNAQELLRILEVKLKGESLVFTHNPWGEYGHEEHVQVFRILSELKDKLGFELFVTSYVSNRSVQLMSRYAHSFGGSPIVREIDRTLAHTLKKFYLENNCWTWLAHYEWPEYETFYRHIQPTEGVEPRTLASFPLNYIIYNFKPNPIKGIARRYLPPSVKSRIWRSFNVE